jgi:hypothetical protein
MPFEVVARYTFPVRMLSHSHRRLAMVSRPLVDQRWALDRNWFTPGAWGARLLLVVVAT